MVGLKPEIAQLLEGPSAPEAVAVAVALAKRNRLRRTLLTRSAHPRSRHGFGPARFPSRDSSVSGGIG